MRYLTIILAIIGLSACSSLVDDLNENPNSPTTASYPYILTGAEVGNAVFHNGEAARKAGIFCGYYTGIDRQHLGFSEYAVTTSDFNGQWNTVFVDAVANSLAAEEAALDAGVEGITLGISQVIRASALGMAASLWGSIPFEDAGRTAVENPSYEQQMQVYAKVQNLLDEALANLGSGQGRPESGADIHFNGNPNSWMEVVHSLKARYYMHTKEYANAYTEAQMGISAPENSWLMPHGTALENANLNYQFFAIASRQADLVTSDFATSLVDPNDMTNPDFSNYRGNAKTDETARYNYLFRLTSVGVQPNTIDGFAAQQEPGQIITYQENLLILAEAGYRSNGFQSGLDHLNEFRSYMSTGGYLSNADPANITFDAFEAPDFENGGIENQDGISMDNALLREILEERYITLFGQLEGFNDTRRTLNESTVRVPVQPNTGNRLPQRFLYPTTEIDRNPNTPKPIPGFFEPTEVNQ